MSQDTTKLRYLYAVVKTAMQEKHAQWNCGDDFQPEVNTTAWSAEFRRYFVIISGEIVKDFAYWGNAKKYLSKHVPKEKQKCGYTVEMEKLGIEP